MLQPRSMLSSTRHCAGVVAYQRMLPLLLRLLPLPSSNGRLLPPEEDMQCGSCKLDASG